MSQSHFSAGGNYVHLDVLRILKTLKQELEENARQFKKKNDLKELEAACLKETVLSSSFCICFSEEIVVIRTDSASIKNKELSVQHYRVCCYNMM